MFAHILCLRDYNIRKYEWYKIRGGQGGILTQFLPYFGSHVTHHPSMISIYPSVCPNPPLGVNSEAIIGHEVGSYEIIGISFLSFNHFYISPKFSLFLRET